MVEALNRSKQGQHVLAATDSLQAQVQEGRLEAGLVIVPSKLQEASASTQSDTLNRILDRWPLPSQQKVYVGLEGQVSISGGQVQLHPATQVKVGNLSLSLNQVSQHLGVSPAVLEQKLSLHLARFKGVTVQSAQLLDDSLVIQGKVNP
jgi:hypothetical protein